MLKRQILSEVIKQYNIDPLWIKNEDLDKLELEVKEKLDQFQTHVDLSIEL